MKLVIYSLLSLIIIIAVSVFIFMKRNDKVDQVDYNSNSEPRIGYVELNVSNIERSVNFYQNTVGFKVLKKDEKEVLLTADGTIPLLSLKEQKEAVQRPNGTTGLFHFAILVPTREELALALMHLLESGYPVQGASDHQYSEAIYLADPDNNGIEIYADRDPSLWKRNSKGGYVGGTYELDANSLLAEAEGEKWFGLSRGTRVGHMHLQVSDIKKSKTFYVDALGFNIVAQDSKMLFVSKDGYHHHIGMNTWAGTGLPQPPKNSVGLKFFNIHFTNEEYKIAKINLNKLGYPYEEKNGEVIVEDPSGITLKLKNE